MTKADKAREAELFGAAKGAESKVIASEEEIAGLSVSLVAERKEARAAWEELRTWREDGPVPRWHLWCDTEYLPCKRCGVVGRLVGSKGASQDHCHGERGARAAL